jgi:hypothetical protein
MSLHDSLVAAIWLKLGAHVVFFSGTGLLMVKWLRRWGYDFIRRHHLLLQQQQQNQNNDNGEDVGRVGLFVGRVPCATILDVGVNAGVLAGLWVGQGLGRAIANMQFQLLLVHPLLDAMLDSAGRPPKAAATLGS